MLLDLLASFHLQGPAASNKSRKEQQGHEKRKLVDKPNQGRFGREVIEGIDGSRKNTCFGSIC